MILCDACRLKKGKIKISLFQNDFDFFGCGLIVGVSLEGDFCSVSALLGKFYFECCLTLGVCGGLESFSYFNS